MPQVYPALLCLSLAWASLAAQVVRMEAKVEAPIRFYLGLGASVGTDSRFTFEQRKVAGDLWMPASMQAHLDARVMAF